MRNRPERKRSRRSTRDASESFMEAAERTCRRICLSAYGWRMLELMQPRVESAEIHPAATKPFEISCGSETFPAGTLRELVAQGLVRWMFTRYRLTNHGRIPK